MIEWETIKILCDFCDENDCDIPVIFERSNYVQKLYQQWKLKKIDLMDTTLFKKGDLELRYNDFPYPFEHGISHMIFWIRPSSPLISEYTPRLNKELKEKLDNLLQNKEYVYFRNTEENRSVKIIPHYHVIVKN